MTEKTDKPKRVRAWHTLLFLLFAVFCIYAVVHTVRQNNKQTSPTAAIGSTVRAGNFAFKATDFSCSGEKYKLLAGKPQGKYCLLAVTVINKDNTEHNWYGDVKLRDAAGNEYDKKDTIREEPSEITDSLNPGNSTSGTVVFDVPEGTTPTVVQFTDNFGSSKAYVKLEE